MSYELVPIYELFLQRNQLGIVDRTSGYDPCVPESTLIMVKLYLYLFLVIHIFLKFRVGRPIMQQINVRQFGFGDSSKPVCAIVDG